MAINITVDGMLLYRYLFVTKKHFCSLYIILFHLFMSLIIRQGHTSQPLLATTKNHSIEVTTQYLSIILTIPVAFILWILFVNFWFIFLAALAALYLTLVSDWVGQTKRQKDKKDKKTKRQKDWRHRPKREINYVTSRQFRTLAMFYFWHLIQGCCNWFVWQTHQYIFWHKQC